MIEPSAKISLCCFTSSAAISLIVLLPIFVGAQFVIDYCALIVAVHFILINVSLRILLRGCRYQVAIRATFLGTVFAIGVVIATLLPLSWKSFGCYLCFLSFFHYSEFLMTALINPRTLSLDSFLLNHSKEYGIAAAASWTEFLLERWLIPGLKELWVVSVMGGILCLAGEILRKAAMITANTNFNHVVQSVHEEGHVLVTHGVYSVCRHPSYVGWFYWSIGTQLLLQNPFCLVAYTLASWKFFYERVMIEELTLLDFFGNQYYEYQQKVQSGLPFIQGYSVHQ